MAAAAVHEENHRLGVVEDRVILGPATGDENRLNTWNFAQTLGEQFAAGVEFMIPWTVTRPTRDKDDFGRVRRGFREKRRRELQTDKTEDEAA
jgi:hypothetical protein